jgi:hypothetical protein
MFTVLTDEGDVITWGNNILIDYNEYLQSKVNKVKKILSYNKLSIFIALTEMGDVFIWTQKISGNLVIQIGKLIVNIYLSTDFIILIRLDDTIELINMKESLFENDQNLNIINIVDAYKSISTLIILEIESTSNFVVILLDNSNVIVYRYTYKTFVQSYKSTGIRKIYNIRNEIFAIYSNGEVYQLNHSSLFKLDILPLQVQDTLINYDGIFHTCMKMDKIFHHNQKLKKIVLIGNMGLYYDPFSYIYAALLYDGSIYIFTSEEESYIHNIDGGVKNIYDIHGYGLGIMSNRGKFTFINLKDIITKLN